MNKISVVIPVYNNEENLPDLFQQLEKVLGQENYEIVFVDDGSRDDSWRLLTEFTTRRPGTKAVKLSRNFGAHTACVAGLMSATGGAAILMSADLQDPTELIPQMAALWDKGNKVVLAVREGRQDPLLQRLFAGIYYRVLRWFVFSEMPLGGFDFVLIDRQLIDLIVRAGEKNTTLMGLILWMGFKRAMIPYVRRARTKGRSMWTLRKKVKYFIDSVLAFSYSPIRPVQWMGMTLSCAGLIYAAVLIAAKILNDSPVPGWTTLMVVILVLGGAQMFAIGVIGEYVWRTLDETKRRPLFIVDESVEGPALNQKDL